MIAWYSLVLLFLLPAADLAQRMLGLPATWVVAGDIVVTAALLWYPRTWFGWPRPTARLCLAPIAACVILAAAVYALRVSSFNFSPYGENIYDLHYIASLVQAHQFPAAELWIPGTELRHYYYIGFYSVAFYTRLLGLPIGTGYALFLLAVPVVVFANYWAIMRGHAVYRGLAAFAATFPSTGLSLLVFSGAIDIADHVRGMAHVRLPEWIDLAPKNGFLAAVIDGNAYPIEGLAHLLGSLGDLHPPVFTFLLLSVVLGALLAGDDGRQPVLAAAISGAALPLAFALNPWTVPCFALLAAYAGLRRLQREDLQAAAAGFAVTVMVLLAVMVQMDLQTSSVGLNWVPPERRGSLPLLLTVWGPLLFGAGILLATGSRRIESLLFIAMVIGLEIILMDDAYGERYERFNGVLKIGSFALAGWTACLLADAGRSQRRWVPVIVLLPLLTVSVLQLRDALAPSTRKPMAERNWALQPVGMLQREDHRLLFAALQARCEGLTLERLHASAYAHAPLVSTLLGWPTYSGWPAHLSQIGAIGDVERRRSDQLQAWFQNPEPTLLLTWNVGYVLIDHSLGWDAQTIALHAVTLAPHYRFVPLGTDKSGPMVGYFAASALSCEAADVPSGGG